jgi:hypothetical protein
LPATTARLPSSKLDTRSGESDARDHVTSTPGSVSRWPPPSCAGCQPAS